MKRNVIRQFLLLPLVIILLAGCSSRKGLLFSNRQWHISDYYGQIIDRDTTYRMTFGNGLIPVDLAIISSIDSLIKYPGLENFMTDILHTARLDSAEILFYAPAMQTMFVKPKGSPTKPLRPSSISSGLDEEKPFTMWIYQDDVEDWVRKPGEMYTYTYFNKKKKQILVVDFYDYGEEPIAQIFVFQTNGKKLEKIGLQRSMHWPFLIHDLRDYERDVEFWSSYVNAHRQLAFANYKIGQEQKQRKQ